MKHMNKIYVLNTYGNDLPEDGLSIVYHRVKHIGEVVDDSRYLEENSKVLVAGIPFLYTDRLSTRNNNIAYTTYEDYPVPTHWTEALNTYYSQIIVPHASVKKLFLESELTIPITVVQQGFTRLPMFPTQTITNSVFTLGFLGAPVKRKNLDLLIEAINILKQKFDIHLNVHVSKYYDWLPADEIRPWLEKQSNVTYTEGYKSETELSEWYSNLSCYIFPSSGEGWSFTPRESLYLGIPTITTDIPVHTDLTRFCHMIECPVTANKIEAAVEMVTNNLNYYQYKAFTGSEWISENSELQTWTKIIKEL